ncbi:MAG: hypothetical protein AB7V42_14080 [Thermoleophilia bacterium]
MIDHLDALARLDPAPPVERTRVAGTDWGRRLLDEITAAEPDPPGRRRTARWAGAVAAACGVAAVAALVVVLVLATRGADGSIGVPVTMSAPGGGPVADAAVARTIAAIEDRAAALDVDLSVRREGERALSLSLDEADRDVLPALIAPGRLVIAPTASWRSYRAPVTNAGVASATAVTEPGAAGGEETMLSLTFTADGGSAFAAITREVAQDGNIAGRAQSITIAVDGRIVSRADVDYREYPAGLGSGSALVSLRSEIEARTLAAQIETGPLPLSLRAP